MRCAHAQAIQVGEKILEAEEVRVDWWKEGTTDEEEYEGGWE
jgi:hypothetical protein